MAGVELGMHGGVILSVCTAGAGKSLANNVRLILVACEGLIRLRFAKSSQASQSSSARISPEPLSV